VRQHPAHAEWEARVENRERWLSYLAKRRGGLEWDEQSYKFRCRRYDAVLRALVELGLANGDLVYDVGAGACDFNYRLCEFGWHLRYVPIDGAIDGTDIEQWCPVVSAEFFVAIELIEHLEDPLRLLEQFERYATKGAVVTTPNPGRIDVFAIDETHRSEVWPHELRAAGWSVAELDLFGKGADTLRAIWRAK
jgi:hypothetical protein